MIEAGRPQVTGLVAPKEFDKKIVLVTGVSRPNGLGRAIAKRFAEEGAEAVVFSSTVSSEEMGKDRERELAELGTKATWIGADLSQESQARGLVAAAVDLYGRVDVLVSNAGVTRNKPFPMMKTEMWNEVINTNLNAAYYLTHEAYKAFPKQDGGAIVLVGSPTGKYGLSGQENYAAAKAGLSGLNKALAQDLGRRNIRSNMVLPGLIETDMSADVDEWSRQMTIDATPLGRLARAEDVAEVVLFLASPRAAMLTGQEIEIDGGLAGGGNAILALRREKYQKPEPAKK